MGINLKNKNNTYIYAIEKADDTKTISPLYHFKIHVYTAAGLLHSAYAFGIYIQFPFGGLFHKIYAKKRRAAV